MDARLESLVDRDGPPEEPPGRLDWELDSLRSILPILVDPCVPGCQLCYPSGFGNLYLLSHLRPLSY